MLDVPTYHYLGVSVNPLDVDNLNRNIKRCLSSDGQLLILSQNLHSVYVFHHDDKMRRLHALPHALKRVDGMPLVWFGRLLGYPLKREDRVTWVDWMYPLMANAEKYGWRIFYIGAKPGVAERGADILRRKFPKLCIQVADGYFNMDRNHPENRRRLETIHEFKPHILVVGMGMPRQEHWILDNLSDLDVPVVLTSGAAIEYVAGVVSTPPRWMGRWGLEWFFRLQEHPGRFWKRYLIEPWFVAWLFTKDLFHKLL